MKVKAKFTNKTKQAIFERDWWCIICWIATWNIQFHHYKFWTHSNYWKDRNDVKEWVSLCDKHHLEAHSCSMWEWVRQECYNYINKKYEI
jgi:hypothetical protein